MVFKKVESRLTKDGWVLIRVCGSHHMYKKAGHPGMCLVPNHGSRDISIGVIKDLEKVTGLTLRS